MRLAGLRDRLQERIFAELEDVQLNGHPVRRLPHSLNVSFSGVEGESLMLSMDEVAVSSGSACTSASMEPSYVLRAMGVSDELAHASLRFGLGRSNTAEQVEYVADRLVENVTRLRRLSPLHEVPGRGRRSAEAKGLGPART